MKFVQFMRSMLYAIFCKHLFGRILTGLSIFMLFASALAASAEDARITIYAPATPASIPLIFAAERLPDTRVHIFFNHSQANCLFLRDEISILSTGLSVGVSFYRQQMPVVILNSYVTGLTYLVSRKSNISNFSDLKGEKIYLPFPGCPVEETTRYFIENENLRWKEDVLIGYADPDAAVRLLRNGRIFAAALPEPFATLARSDPDLHVSMNYKELWARHAGIDNGYPQVAIFAKREWAEKHPLYIQKLNQELTKAVEWIASFPAEACEKAKPYFQFSESVLCPAIKGVSFRSLNSEQLQKEIKNYYHIIGNPLDESFEGFFYTGPQ